MLVVVFAVSFVCYVILYVLGDQPVAILFLVVVLFIPTLVFIYLSAIRAGLVSLKASGPPNVKKLGMATLKLSRFNMMINNLILSLFGLGGSVLFLVVLMPDLWNALTNDLSLDAFTDSEIARDSFGQLPSALPFFWALAAAISVGVIGTSSAAVAATAAEDGPNHDAVWGVTQQFLPQFTLTALLLILPCVLIILASGSPFEPILPLLDQPLHVWLGAFFYLIWAGCAICAGKALAYVRTVEVMEIERQKMHSDMLGEVIDSNDLRAMRLARQEKAKLSNI